MDVDRRIALVMKRPTEEVVTVERLRQMFETKKEIRHYIGYEISGFLHLGGLAAALKIHDFIGAGIRPMIWLADYHSVINNKLGGDVELIRKVANGYFKHAFISMGLDESKVDYVMASDVYNQDYWGTVLKVGNEATLSRVKRAMTIMGRKESDESPASFIVYPLMQAADIFHMDVDVMHAGMDQRKVHMLAIDVAEKIGKQKPIAVHMHLLPSLKSEGRMNPEDAKMSKSKPDTAIFVNDSEDEIMRKMKAAVCPQKETEGNPVFEILKYLILRDDASKIRIERPAKYGGDIQGTLPEIEKMYRDGAIFPLYLKNGVATELARMLKPSRDYFAKHPDFVEQLKAGSITR
jgi:tyrosyl-tRNA synthetase